MNRLISFGDERYYGSLKALEKSALKFGVNTFKSYTQAWLKTTLYWKEHSNILSQPRGAGYWIWKPYIILDSFKELNDGDVVMYSDSAVIVINDLSYLFEQAKEKSIIVFRLAGGHLNKTWTKKDCFVLMDADTLEFYNNIQTTGSYSLWKKDEKSISFLNEWIKYLSDPRIVTDQPNQIGQNTTEFKDHRHDQSVLSILTQKHQLERFRDPSQFGVSEISDFSNSLYPQLFNHHRMKLFG